MEEEDLIKGKDELVEDVNLTEFDTSAANLATTSEINDQQEDELVEGEVDMQDSSNVEQYEDIDDMNPEVEEIEETEEEKIQVYWRLNKAFSIDEYPPFQSLQQIENKIVLISQKAAKLFSDLEQEDTSVSQQGKQIVDYINLVKDVRQSLHKFVKDGASWIQINAPTNTPFPSVAPVSQNAPLEESFQFRFNNYKETQQYEILSQQLQYLQSKLH